MNNQLSTKLLEYNKSIMVQNNNITEKENDDGEMEQIVENTEEFEQPMEEESRTENDAAMNQFAVDTHINVDKYN